jgi:hypothetical protein
MNTQTQLSGPVKIIAQITWLALTGFILVSFAIGIPVRYHSLLTSVGEINITSIFGVPPFMEAATTARLDLEEMQALQSLGLSIEFYAGYMVVFDIALVLIGSAIGFLIFWRRNQDWVALWFSFIIVLLGTNGTSMVVPSLAFKWVGWIPIITWFGVLGMISNVHILFISPDGRFVPGWSKILAAGCTGILIGSGIFGSMFFQLESMVAFAVFFTTTPIWFAVILAGIFSQVYRYVRVSDSAQRQQTKWVTAGLAAVAVGFGFNVIFLGLTNFYPGLPRVVLNLVRAPLVNLWMVFLPICLAIAIFRYRLWDIDVIIRRTLQYSLLTGLLALVYFSGVSLLQALFSAVSGQQSPAAVVLSTLAIAALFNPLRRRVQDFIDRRFYRQKYNAEKALAEFAAAARSETDLEQLSARLITTVQETLQPEKVKLWIRTRKS